MPNLNDLKQSKFLTKNDVDPPALVTIASYGEENVALEGAEPQMKWTLSFKELDKPLVLNMTNGQTIAGIVGSGEFKDWINHEIVLYNDPNIMFAGQRTGGIRVRAPQKTSNIPEPHPDIVDVVNQSKDIPF